jgi:hypothetical protein
MATQQVIGFRLGRFGEWAMVALSGSVIAGGAAAMDETVRRRLVNVLVGDGSIELAAAAGARVQRILPALDAALGYFGPEGASAILFVLAALVLFSFMLRT